MSRSTPPPAAPGLDAIGQFAAQAMALPPTRPDGRGGPGLRVGHQGLDALTRGFRPGQLVVLAARPGAGKTTLALNWLLRAAVRERASCALFSLDMDPAEAFRRLLSAHARVALRELPAGALEPAEAARLQSALDELRQLPIFLHHTASITVPELRAMVERHRAAAGQGLDLLVIDDLQRLRPSEDTPAGRREGGAGMGGILRDLKRLAGEFGLPVVVLAQLQPGSSRRTHELSDLPDAGSIVQAADLVLFLRRNTTPTWDPEEADRSAELSVARHRNGPTGRFALYFEEEYVTFRELLRTADPGEDL